MSEEERKKIEEKSYQEQKKRVMVQEIVEKTPDWILYCVTSQDQSVLDKMDAQDFWEKLIDQIIKRSEE